MRFGFAESAGGVNHGIGIIAIAGGTNRGQSQTHFVETPAMMSFLRSVASTALANRGSSNAFTVVLLIIDISGNASVSSGTTGPHISGEVAVTMIGTPKTLTAFAQRDERCVFSSATGMSLTPVEQPNLMVNEK